jgi:formylglycine-generating enzyme
MFTQRVSAMRSSQWSIHQWMTSCLIVALAIWHTSSFGVAEETITVAIVTEETVSFPWATIPAGRFLMGGQVPAEQVAKDFEKYGRSAEYFRDEYPQHLVEISKPFYLACTEVTVGQFKAFVADTSYKTMAERDGEGGWGFDKSIGKCTGRDIRFTWRDPGYPQTDDHPVVNVTWEDCQEYCRWLSKKQNRVVRLPTEAEWEYACRANTKSYFHTGNTDQSLLKGARTLEPSDATIKQHVQDIQIAESDSITFPVPVKSYASNAFGLYDMHGNVWEWTSDWHGDEYYANSPRKDPQGPVQGDVRVRRGGGWNSFPLWARASFRNWNSPESRCVNLGFRVVGEFHPLELAEFEKTQPIRLVFAGDIMLDGDPGHAITSGQDPFVHCANVLADADLTIGNLECVLGRGGEQILKPYSFRAASKSPEVLKRHFQVLSLANNHSWDFGAEGILDCMKVMRDHNLGYFGAGPDIVSARQGLMLTIKGRKVLLLGYNGFNAEYYQATESQAGSAPLIHEQILEDIRNGKKQRGADIVIPYVHWGAELVSMPRESQRTLAREWIEAGADAVIGGHPHVTQTIETYRGAPIVYSLGNFVFDYFPVDPPQWTGWIARLNIPAQGPIDLEVIAVELDQVGIPHLVDNEE